MKKRHLFSVLCGVLFIAFVSNLSGDARAQESPQVLYNQAGIALLSEEKVSKGDNYTAPNGQDVPSVITYIDSAGGKTNYLSVRQISELLGIDIAWDSETGNVDIAPNPETDTSSVQVGKGTEPASVPKYGEKVGPFTEIDPERVDTKQNFVTATATIHTVSTAGTSGLELPCFAEDANYIVYTVKNNGNNPQLVSVRQRAVLGRSQSFTTVLLPAGETLQRAFYLEEGAEDVQSILEFGVIGYQNLETDVTESVKTYR